MSLSGCKVYHLKKRDKGFGFFKKLRFLFFQKGGVSISLFSFFPIEESLTSLLHTLE